MTASQLEDPARTGSTPTGTAPTGTAPTGTAPTGTAPTGTAPTGTAAVVAGIYAAFARGDVPAILDRLSDGVAWEQWADNWAQRADVPYLRARTGPRGAAEFFALLGSATVLDFAVLDVIGDGRQVVAEVRAAFELPGGGRWSDEELHLWTFDDEGRVVRFRHYLDTAKHIAAARGEDTTAGGGAARRAGQPGSRP